MFGEGSEKGKKSWDGRRPAEEEQFDSLEGLVLVGSLVTFSLELKKNWLAFISPILPQAKTLFRNEGASDASWTQIEFKSAALSTHFSHFKCRKCETKVHVCIYFEILYVDLGTTNYLHLCSMSEAWMKSRHGAENIQTKSYFDAFVQEAFTSTIKWQDWKERFS